MTEKIPSLRKVTTCNDLEQLMLWDLMCEEPTSLNQIAAMELIRHKIKELENE